MLYNYQTNYQTNKCFIPMLNTKPSLVTAKSTRTTQVRRKSAARAFQTSKICWLPWFPLFRRLGCANTFIPQGTRAPRFASEPSARLQTRPSNAPGAAPPSVPPGRVRFARRNVLKRRCRPLRSNDIVAPTSGSAPRLPDLSAATPPTFSTGFVFHPALFP